MNVRGVRNITNFTETVALLGLTTDLVGEDAANALGLILTNTDAVVGEVLQVGSALTALGNQFRGGESGIISIAEDIARSTAEFNLSAESVLAFSAVFAQAGSRAEKTGTVFQRSIRALTEAASEAASGSPQTLVAVAEAAGVSFERLSAVINSGDYTTGLQILATALQNLESIGSDTQLTRGNLLSLLFGGERPPVRIAEVLGVLAKNAGEVERALGLANEEFENANALLLEAGRTAGTTAGRLQVVTNQLASQGRDIGAVLAPGLLLVAENFRVIEVAAVGAATALAVGFGQRRIAAIRATATAVTAGLSENVVSAQARVVAATLAVTKAEEVRANRSAFSAAKQVAADNSIAAARQKALVATNALAVAEANLARNAAPRAVRAFATSVAFLGGPLGIVLAAVTAGSLAFSLFRDRNEEATEANNRFTESLERLNREIRSNQQGIGGLTGRGQALEDAATARAELIAEREQVTAQFGQGPNPRQAQAADRQRRARIAAINDQIALLDDSVRQLNRSSQQLAAIPTAASIVTAAFDELTSSLDLPVRRIRDFISQARDATREATVAARATAMIAGADPEAQRTQELIFGREQEINRVTDSEPT